MFYLTFTVILVAICSTVIGAILHDVYISTNTVISIPEVTFKKWPPKPA